MSFIKSISGIRATLNDGLRPDVLSQYVTAYCNSLPSGAIVVGRDGRPSGTWIADLVKATISACGRKVYYLDIAPTPTVQLITEKSDAVGGISITASHNPEMWNGLKFLTEDGVFLNQTENELFWQKVENNDMNYSTDPLNSSSIENIDAIEVHINSIIDSGLFDIQSISNYFKSKNFKVVVDAVNASGSLYVKRLLDKFGCQAIGLFTNNTGIFPHTPEPITENLKQLSQAVVENKADLGIAVDPDADRLVIIDETGNPIGEEKTIAIAVKSVLDNYDNFKTNYDKLVVVNLSTSAMVEGIATEYNAQVFRSPVGEINVVNKMKETNAIVGGEGSGGVILPHIHYGRDSLVGITLLLSLLAKLKSNVSALSNLLPEAFMKKVKIEVSSNPFEIVNKLKELHSNQDINTDDGVRLKFNSKEWVHIRASNTESIIRIIAESDNESKTEELIKEFKTQITEIL